MSKISHLGHHHKVEAQFDYKEMINKLFSVSVIVLGISAC